LRRYDGDQLPRFTRTAAVDITSVDDHSQPTRVRLVRPIPLRRLAMRCGYRTSFRDRSRAGVRPRWQPCPRSVAIADSGSAGRPADRRTGRRAGEGPHFPALSPSLRHRGGTIRPWGNDPVAKDPNTLKLDLDDLPGSQDAPSCEAYAGRGGGEDHIAGLQGPERVPRTRSQGRPPVRAKCVRPSACDRSEESEHHAAGKQGGLSDARPAEPVEKGNPLVTGSPGLSATRHEVTVLGSG
jgi:hypothetical protein